MRLPFLHRWHVFGACLLWLFCASAPTLERSHRTVMPAAHMERFFAPRGGANLLWYALGPDCDREPYGIVPNYHEPGVRVQVQSQLAVMFAAGMRRLSLGLHFAHGFHDGTLIDSSDPAQIAQAAQNVTALLADVKNAGFQQVLFRFFPTGAISPPDP